MGWSLTLGSISGIRVRIHFTFLLLLAWVGLSQWHQDGGNAAVMALAYILLLFACVVAHEFGHILTARRFGAETLDVVLLPIGGVARMKQIPEKPAQELLVALAGPAVNVVIFCLLIAVIGPNVMAAQISAASQGGGPDLPLATQLAIANLVLAVFNLLPAFPMDGGRALRALLAMRLGRVMATDIAARIGHFLALLLGVYGLFNGMPLLILVATFIYFGASSEANGTRLHAFADRMRARDAMITRLGQLGPTAVLADAVDLLVHSTQHDIPVLDAMGKPVGLLTRDAIARALHAHGGDYPVIEVMQPGLPTVGADASLDAALRLIETSGVPAVAVVDGHGALAGLITIESLGHLLMLSRQNAQ